MIARFPTVEIGVQVAREVDRVGSAGVSLAFEIPFFDRNQGNIALERARRVQVEAEYDARLLEARAEVVRLVSEIALVDQELKAATDGASAAARIAELSRSAAMSGALTPLVAVDMQERAFSAQLRRLAIEQARAELVVALALTTGTNL